MQYVRLGRSNLQVSRIAFGTWQLGGDWGATAEEDAIAAMHYAMDQGVNFFDTAQGYGFGASERLIAKALRGQSRDQFVIATKGGLRRGRAGGVDRDASAEWVRRGVDESLKALGTDYIDLYQVHWPDSRTAFAETAGLLAQLVDAGKIRHIGVSNFDPVQMHQFSQTRPVETLQPPYNVLRREIEVSTLPYAREHDIGVLVYGPLAHGLLSGSLSIDSRFTAGDWRSKSEIFRGDFYRRLLQIAGDLRNFAELELGINLPRLAIAWTLRNPPVHAAIVGTRNPGHIDDAVTATDLSLDESVLRRVDEIVGETTSIPGPSPEMDR